MFGGLVCFILAVGLLHITQLALNLDIILNSVENHDLILSRNAMTKYTTHIFCLSWFPTYIAHNYKNKK